MTPSTPAPASVGVGVSQGKGTLPPSVAAANDPAIPHVAHTKTTSLGGFETPKPSKTDVSNALKTGSNAPTPVNQSYVMSSVSGQSAPAPAPVEIPKGVSWSNAKTLVDSGDKGNGTKAVVTYVLDGDTAKLNAPGNPDLLCRIDGYDAPETTKPSRNQPGQPLGNEAWNTMRSLIEKKEVTVKYSEASKDPYGRYICQIEVSGKDVSIPMLQQGLGEIYHRYVKPNQANIQAENYAKQNKLGVWGLPSHETPWDYRKRQRKQ